MSPAHPLITLTTDFGIRDHYVAQMKGMIYRTNPTVTIIDVTHEIGPQDIRHAAFLLGDLERTFPAGTVHVAVVDPGVGTSRAILAVCAGEQYYIAPDNGLLTLVLQRHQNAKVVSVAQPLGDDTIAPTFHGRDIMAPAAAHLTLDKPIEALGNKFDRLPERLAFLAARTESNELIGEVAWIDRFGNLVTTLSESQLNEFDPDRARISLGGIRLTGLKSFYAAVSPGDPLALIGSSGYLEIAVNGGHAADRFQVVVGERVIVNDVECDHLHL